MKTSYFKKSVYALTLIALAVGVSSCDSDDDGKKVIILPEVVAQHSISGVVTSISGDAISDATVTLSGADQASTTTNAEGVYAFEALEEAGSYQVEFSASGKVTSTSDVVIASTGKSQAIIASARLVDEVAEVAVSATAETAFTTETETVSGNEDASTAVTTTVPVGAVEDNKEVVITVQPVYDEVATTRNAERIVVDQFDVDITLSTGEAYVLASAHKATGAFTVPIDGGCFVRVVYDDGTPSDTFALPSGAFSLIYDRSCMIYIEGDGVITKTDGNESLEVTPTGGIIDRIYASGAKTVDVKYSFKVGAEVTGIGKAREILEKYVAVSNGTKILHGTMLSNFEVPEGAKYTFTATQNYSNCTIRFDGKDAAGKQYKDVATGYTVEVPAHNGGGN